MLGDKDSELRKMAVIELGRLKNERVKAPLIRVLKDPDPWVRLRASNVLGRYIPD